MKQLRILLSFLMLTVVLTAVAPATAHAQCAMCSINAEQGTKNGNTQGKGLNTGVLYLLAIPYVLVTVVGIVWYKKYRRKNTTGVAIP